jgi:hypothetical protein
VTTYVVLRRLKTLPPSPITPKEGQSNPGDAVRIVALPADAAFWEEMGEHEAHSGSHAIRLCVASLDGDDREGTYVAAPAKSWRPEPVRVKTTTVVTVGGTDPPTKGTP